MTETVVSSTIETTGLPESWEEVTLSDIGIIASGGTPKTKDPSNFDGEIPWITPADLSGYTKKMISGGKRSISRKGLETSSARLLPAGTVLFSSRAPVGYVAVAEGPISTNQGFKSLIPGEGVFNEFVYYYLKASKQLAESYSSGTTFRELPAKAFGRLPIPLPPLNEQRRIVEKIEELFTKLDAGEESLGKTRTLLKKYRQSVLKAAVTGELSREWREEHEGELEPAPELLARILEERREKWTTDDVDKGLPQLPDQWVWTTIEQLGAVTGGITKNRQRATLTRQLPYLRVANVYANRLQLEDVVEIGVKESELDRVLLREGDLLIVEGNGSPDQIGRVAVWDGSVSPCVHQNHLIKVRLPMPKLSWWVLTWLLSAEGREHIRRVASSTSGLYTLSLSKVRNLAIPLPPLEEQTQILEELDRKLSIVDNLEATIEENLKRSGSLRQSILKRAFSGRLVGQDAEDEPASALLRRVKVKKGEG